MQSLESNLEPGYAGALCAARHPALAERFHFWRGASGRRYAFTRFPPDEAPAYEDGVALFVRRVGGKPAVIDVRAGPDAMHYAPTLAHEVHVHIVLDRAVAVGDVLRDLRALVETPSFEREIGYDKAA